MSTEFTDPNAGSLLVMAYGFPPPEPEPSTAVSCPCCGEPISPEGLEFLFEAKIEVCRAFRSRHSVLFMP